ncbi:MAG: VCBS repeat-containing protein, partial [Lutimonas sp.]
NNDGFLDIYLCRGGWFEDESLFTNKLYINNGDLTFTEKGEELGLGDKNRAIQAVFFDYDSDNDVDVFISNTPDFVGTPKVEDLEKVKKDPATIERRGWDKLYQNDGTGHFTDVTLAAGIAPELGYGLNPQVGDLNNDGLLDIYVCNDFDVPDFVYVNNGNGTFTESRNELLKHMSFNSMGSDLADLNNDGHLDLLTLDMNPEDYIRSKTTMGMTSIDKFEEMVNGNYHYQYMHNMLQLNNGNGSFSEISKMAGIGDTDWSWAVLSADFDLDGLNDIYVTNGVFRDVIDKDKNNEILEVLRANKRKPTNEDFLAFAKMLPQQKLVNYFFRNNGDLTFENTSIKWTDSIPTFSNGAVYADFDNDGDLDIAVNNMNDEATILKNNAIQQNLGDYLEINFNGPEGNKFGTGVTCNITFDDETVQVRQLINTRGFLSSISNSIHFGIPKSKKIKNIEITWPDGKSQNLSEVTVNQKLTVNYDNASVKQAITEEPSEKLFTEISIDNNHIDPYFNDYNVQVLLPHKLSQTGPAASKGDVNGDGLEDVFIGGGRTQSGQLLLGKPDGSFTKVTTGDFERDKEHEDVGAVFFDADNDGDQDLYVVSGSYEFIDSPDLLQDRLYLNNGQGNFIRSKSSLPEMFSAGSMAVPADFDNDGDMDLFVGGRVIPGRYPYAPESYLLLNESGVFTIKTDDLSPGLKEVGMVTDASWKDINGDKSLDLIVTGEWMGIEVFLNETGQLVKSDQYVSLNESKGWWNKLLIEDIDLDGDMDIIAGNLGLNYKFHASKEKPFHVYTKDFDFNGTEDVFLAKYYNDKQVPVRGKGCSAQQMPHLAQKIPSYTDFASRDLEGILGPGIKSALHYQATEFRSGIFRNGPDGFVFEPFGNQVQSSPINSILYDDFDSDGLKDILMAGNNYQSEVETTRADAGIGSFLKGDGMGKFTYFSNLESGFFANKDVRDMIEIKLGTDRFILVANNNSKLDLFKIKN